jgi:hypothetical protein
LNSGIGNGVVVEYDYDYDLNSGQQADGFGQGKDEYHNCLFEDDEYIAALPMLCYSGIFEKQLGTPKTPSQCTHRLNSVAI